MKRMLACALLGACFVAPLAGQQKCQMSDTIQGCWNRFLAVNIAQDLEQKATGVDTAGTNLNSTTKNFLPLMSLAGLLGSTAGGAGDSSAGTVAIDLNFLLQAATKDKNAQLQAVVNTKPTLYSPFKALLPEASRDQVATALEKQLGSLADYSLNFTYELINDRFGRGFDWYRPQLSRLLTEAQKRVIEEGGSVGPDTALFKLAAIFQEAGEKVPDDPTNMRFDQAPQRLRQQLLTTVESAARQESELSGQLNAAIQAAHLSSFADLVSNQPQFHFSAKQILREQLADPNELSAKLTWEMGFVNIGDFQRKHGNAASDKEYLDAYEQYVADNADRITRGDRVSLSLEYGKINNLRIMVPTQQLDHTFPGVTKLIGSAGYGRIFQEDKAAQTSTRLDFVASYENVSNDPMRQNRLLATLTVTRKTKDFSIPFGVVYANRSEFLTDVNRKLSAHVGLKFDLEGAK
jgi:hypothetical protein